MKKFISTIITMVTIMAATISVNAYNAEYAYPASNVRVGIGNSIWSSTETTMYNDHVYMPLRTACNFIGAEAYTDDFGVVHASCKNTTVTFDKGYRLSSPISIRYVAEMFNYQVEWDEEKQIVNINEPKTEKKSILLGITNLFGFMK